jgi:hypothetical protein
MLYIISLLSFFSLVLLPFFIYGLYSHYESYKAEKEQEDFIKSLTPGSEWKLDEKPNMNPFAEPSPDRIVTIIETRKNSYGDIWVQYRFENSKGTNERRASDFQELYSKVN